MNKNVWKQSFVVAALTFAATSAYAGAFTTIATNGSRTSGSTSDTNTDAFYIGNLPSTWTLKAQQTSTVYSTVGVYAGNAVGSFIDSVWLDSSTNSYIIGSYFQLENGANGVTEINSIVRTGFSDYTGTLSAAWVYANTQYSSVNGTTPAAGYRMRDPARSDYVASYSATTGNAGGYYDADKVAFRTDVSLKEGNPNSALYLVRFSATGYTYEWTDNAVKIVQGASNSAGTTEGVRQLAFMNLSGFAVTAVPEAETYAMMMAGLAMIGSIVRRRKSA